LDVAGVIKCPGLSAQRQPFGNVGGSQWNNDRNGAISYSGGNVSLGTTSHQRETSHLCSVRSNGDEDTTAPRTRKNGFSKPTGAIFDVLAGNDAWSSWKQPCGSTGLNHHQQNGLPSGNVGVGTGQSVTGNWMWRGQ